MKFLEKELVKKILLISIPIIFGNLLQIAYQLTDLFWVGKLGTDEIAAISITGPLFFGFLSIGIGISVAGLILVSQQKGKKNQQKIDHISGQMMLVTTSIGVFASIIGYLLVPTLISLNNTSEIVTSLAIEYAQISFISIFAIYGIICFKDLMSGTQEMILPLKITILAVILNAILDPILIIYFELGIKGAAYSTVFNQILAFTISIIILVRGNHKIQIKLKELKPDFKQIKNILSLSVPTTIEITAIALSEMVLIYFISKYSTSVIAAFGIGTQIFNIVIFISIGFLVATSTLIGEAIGQNNKKKAKQIGQTSLTFGILINLIIAVFVFFFAKQVIEIFTSDIDVITSGIILLKILTVTFVFFGIEKTLTGAFQGSGNPHIPSTIVIISLWIIQIPLAYILSNYVGLQELGIWLAIVIAGLIAASLSLLLFFKYPWQNKSMVNHN